MCETFIQGYHFQFAMNSDILNINTGIKNNAYNLFAAVKLSFHLPTIVTDNRVLRK